ncbi:universal stress protein [Catenulispora subtropica]|uniref:Universal stress protein n=1 Tax=Catenulispora subtropica TaxID=450798 RepID=A0ABN2TGZ6_9ACTN
MKPTVVVGYDRTPPSERALIEAGREAAWRGASVTVVHAFHWMPVTAPMTYVPMSVQRSLTTAAEEAAADAVHTLNHRYPGMKVESAVVAGPAADALTEASRDADLLVLGNRGRGGFTGLLLGSVSTRALAFASCPTMIVRGTPRDLLDTIVLALDAEDPAEELLEFAFAEASHRDARLRVVNARDLDWGRAARAEQGDAQDAGKAEEAEEADRARAQVLTDVRGALGRLLSPWLTRHPRVRLSTEVADGTPGAVLTAATTHADLVIVGAHRHADGHPGMRLGPVTQTLLHHADCPVVVVPRA